MFNYFLMGGSAYSLGSLPTEAAAGGESGREGVQPAEDYSRLLAKFQDLKSKYAQVKRENSELKEYIAELEDVTPPRRRSSSPRRAGRKSGGDPKTS